MAQYGKKAAEKVERALRERSTGTLKIGRSDQPVKSRAQAIAIGLSEARAAGGKVPDSGAKSAIQTTAAKKRSTSTRAAKTTTATKAAVKRSLPKGPGTTKASAKKKAVRDA